MCEQISSIDKRRLVGLRPGTIPPVTLSSLVLAIKKAVE
jgi:hypothetical protein